MLRAAESSPGEPSGRRGAVRGVNRMMAVGTFTFIGIAVYVLVVTHHLQLPEALEKLAHLGPQTARVHLEEVADISLTAPGVAFASKMLKIGTFEKYDQDRDGLLSHDEFHHFLTDLGKSKLIAHSTTGPIIIKAETGANVKAETRADVKAENGADVKGQVEASAAPKATKAESSSGGGANRMCPELSKELVASFAKQNTIMLAVCDWRMFETFGINWMKHLQEIGIDYYIVGSTDRQTAEFLSGQGNHPCFKFFEDGAEEKMNKEYKYGDEHYIEAVWRKVSVVQQIVDWGFNVIHSDVDAVWFRNPIPYFLGPACQDVDLAVSTDLVSTQNPVGDEGLEVAVFKSVNVNTGMYFVKSTTGGRNIMRIWAGLREVMKHANDQVGMYRLLRGHDIREDDKSDNEKRRLYYTDMGGAPASVGLLSVAILLNGYSFFIPRLHEGKQVRPLGVHMTWLPLSREGKFHRMRDGGLYHDPPEYYTGPQFITADIEFPTAPEGFTDWRDTESMIQTHLKLMDMQLVQVYRVMAIAVILNRTLVLPKLQCYCYKNWFMSEQCRIPGDRVTKFPMECALDQWLRPKVIYNYGDNIVAADGTRRSLLFREYSMLENKRFPAELREKELTVAAATTGCAPGKCGVMNTTHVASLGKEVAYVPQGMKQNDIVKAFDSLKNVKVLRLKGAFEMFGGFDDLTLRDSFEMFLDKVVGNWCCRAPVDIKKGMKEKEKLAIHWTPFRNNEAPAQDVRPSDKP